MSAQDLEQRARELLPELPPMAMTIAGDGPDAGHWYRAEQMRDYAARAIAAALRQQPAPVVDDAAAALEAAREDARSGDWVLVPRELPRDALNYLAGFDMDSVGNSTGDAASECWGELVSMAANEVHELEFSNPVFHAGTNLTVRRGTKWYGREWAVVKVGEARVIVKLSTMTHKLSRLDDHWLRHEHDPACRTVAGIVAEMQRVYPGFDAYEDVTLVSFALPGPIADLARAQGVQP